jgi:hypothetical protein
MADKLNIGVKEIYNLKKKLGRRLREYQKVKSEEAVAQVGGGGGNE